MLLTIMTYVLFIVIASTSASTFVDSGFESTLGKFFLSAFVEFLSNFIDKLLSALQKSVFNSFISVHFSLSVSHFWRLQTYFGFKCLLLVLVLHFLFYFFPPWNSLHVHRFENLSDLLLFDLTAKPPPFFVKISNFNHNQGFFIILNI